MTIADQNPIDRDEVELLLPWYINGTLDERDTARVEAFLSTTTEFDAQIASIRQDRDESIFANEEIRGPAPGALDRLMRDIETESPAPGIAKSSFANLFAGLEEFLRSLTPGRLGFAAAAAALLIVVQAGMLGSGMLQGGGSHTTASGETGVAAGSAFLIQFKPDADISAIATFLENNDAVVISGPENGTIFKIRVGDKMLEEAARKTLQNRLSQNTALVEMVLPSQ